jgi:hypothetical protein
MKSNKNLVDYNQSDIENLFRVGSIEPEVDEYANISIQNIAGQLYSSSITIPLINVVYIPEKIETKIDTNFYEL